MDTGEQKKAAEEFVQSSVAFLVDSIVRDVASLPDRPREFEDQPEVMILTESELRNVLWSHLWNDAE